ncbi:MAG: hypothetical protein QOH89_663 [Pseudonocardiales bacterium]|jgi:hypothetical protein|nr:hypothetical protein [Pseudonocardiales bacterium]
MTVTRGPETPLDVLRRITSAPRRQAAPGERCEMCATQIGDEHSHVVNLASRGLMCTCRGCYLLFTAEGADLNYRAVPDRYLSFGDFVLDGREWDELQIPVGLAFLFRNSVQERVIAFYPGPAGATESELPLEAWQNIVDRHPELALVRPDVEALLVRRTKGAADPCYLVPIDACYELVGTLRTMWRGFDGGQQARAAIEDFFVEVRRRSRPAEIAHE